VVKEAEKQLEKLLRPLTQSDDTVEDWLLEGIRRWIDVFLPGRITLRIYPFEEAPAFHLLGNLKRDAFVDADIGNIMFAYGARPNVRLTVLGLITSLPPEGEQTFDPMAHLPEIGEGDDELPREAQFELGFRRAFESMDGFEKLARFSYYPNVTVYPIGVYRRVPVSPLESVHEELPANRREGSSVLDQ
jgi:hypothetical protein